MKRIVAFLVAVAAALLACSAAFADALGCAHGSTCQKGQVGAFTPPGTHTGGTAGTGGGTLPFTGLNLATVAAIALLLVASGFVLHRVTRRRQ